MLACNISTSKTVEYLTCLEQRQHRNSIVFLSDHRRSVMNLEHRQRLRFFLSVFHVVRDRLKSTPLTARKKGSRH